MPSYPSNCLAFLNSPPTVQPSQTAHVRLNIIIVGAGLGGLATAIALASTGHTVTIYEQAAELGEVLPHPTPPLHPIPFPQSISLTNYHRSAPASKSPQTQPAS
jgi:choline dehydrogenase-like flavoprotein